MSEHIVIDHRLDEAAGVYRLIVGVPVIEVQAMRDEEGIGITDDEGQPLTEQVTAGYDDIIDVVFDAHDDRWYKRSADDIAAEQRAIVQATIDERPPPASQAPTAAADLPGVGAALNAASP